jgi:hypothetical protein
MTRLLAFLGATAGGYAGWALAASMRTFAGFVGSIVGTGVGLYWGRRIGRHYEG